MVMVVRAMDKKNHVPVRLAQRPRTCQISPMRATLAVLSACLAGALTIACSGTQPPAAPAGPLRVSAAASLTDVLTTADAAWEKTGGMHVEPNFAASNVLARQIVEGAPVDVFISADNAQMERVAQAGAVDANDRLPLLSNQLVVVVPTGRALTGPAPGSLADPSVKRLALGDPQGVPAGVYAQAWLERAGLWKQVAPKVVPAASVRAALAAVESGNADAGVVYRTDARGRAGVQIALEVPLSDAPPIVYPAAALKRSARLESARRYLQFLRSEQGRRIFTDAAFLLPEAAPAK